MSMTTEVAAATAGTITEAPRDLPNVPADRQALGLVRPYLGMVAWPTVFVAVAIVAAFATVTTLGAMHIIPLWSEKFRFCGLSTHRAPTSAPQT